MMLKIYQVDAFADKPFAGNPAAVCLLKDAIEDRLMQQIAVEMNLSETAFLLPEADGYRLRWFTPGYEVDLCGHATLASAHVLWTTGLLQHQATAKFYSRSGLLQARRIEKSIELDFPAQPPHEVVPPDALLTSLNVKPVYSGYNGYDYLLVVEHQEILEGLKPDFRLMGEVEMRGVIVSAPASNGDLDFVSRFFAPSAGIDEDPVTGSAHCCLGPYWSARLQKNSLKARQISARGGEVEVRLKDDRVYLIGKARTVLKGELIVE